MRLEIERRFLVTKDIRHLCQGGIPIVQGYLDSDAGTTTRVRIAGDAAFFTVKGRRTGCVRSEHETAFPMGAAQRILDRLPTNRIIRKRRFELWHGGALWEVDHFEGALAGLVIAEIELARPNQLFLVPDWIGLEITHDGRYGNSRLCESRPAAA